MHFIRRTSTNEADAPNRADKPRGRGLGPFSGGQITIIIVTLALVVGFPVSALAVTGNNVFLTDATSGKHATVNSNGQLATQASGTVTARPQSPNSLFHSEAFVVATNGNANCQLFVNSDAAYPNGAGGTGGMVLTQFHVAAFGIPGLQWSIHRFSNCSDTELAEGRIPGTLSSSAPGGDADEEQTFPSGIAIAQDGKLYIRVAPSFTSTGSVEATAHGYLTNNTSIPANA